MVSGWCILTVVENVLAWRDEFNILKDRLEPLFVRPEPRRQTALYLEALLSGAQRKNGWQLAEQIGDARPWRTQRVLSHVQWDQDAARDICRDYVIEHIGSSDGVLVVDETGFLKKGTHSAGVAPQYSGTAGKVQNCQIGVFLAYASGKGHALIDRALYLPEPWCADAGRRAEAAIPEQAVFATKPALAQQMIARALDAGVPCAWVLGDEVYGSDHKLQRWLEQREQPFVLTVRSNEKLWATKPAREGVREKKTGWYTAAELTRARPASAWQSHSAGAGTKGERVYDWARLRLARRPGPPRAQWQRWLLIRRNRKDPEDVAYYVVFGPANCSLGTLARVAGLRWTVEECFEVAKQEVGLDDYEVRSWHGWYRHITLAMLALAFLVAMRLKLNAEPPQTGKEAPSRPVVDFSVCEIRHLISRLLLRVEIALEHIFAWSFWRRMHQAVAKACHWKGCGLCPA
jgi:SRSO17 transposase